jgi:hypothetical protein
MLSVSKRYNKKSFKENKEYLKYKKMPFLRFVTLKRNHEILVETSTTSSNNFNNNSSIKTNLETTTSLLPQNITNQTGRLTNKSNDSFPKCPEGWGNFRGPLNVTLILEALNLTTLVEFHEPYRPDLVIDDYKRNLTLFYLNENSKRSRHKHPRFDEFWELWHTTNMSLLNISRELLGGEGRQVSLGGAWRPYNCTSVQKIAIIIPFRDRIPHLRVNLEYLHDILQRQMLDYRFFVVESNYPMDYNFNKGRIMNAGDEILRLM